MIGNVPYGGTKLGSGGGGGGTLPTTSNITPTETAVSGAGSTTSGIFRLSVFNSGNANGTFNGITLFPGVGREYGGYLDPNTNDFKRLASYVYDATGTTFEISETP